MQARIETVEGRKVIRVTEPPVIPQRLDALLAELLVLRRVPVVAGGFSSACAARTHRLVDWVAGYYRGMDLVLLMCADCQGVEVRDRSLDIMPGLKRRPTWAPRRRDKVLGWYSGARRNERIYR